LKENILTSLNSPLTEQEEYLGSINLDLVRHLERIVSDKGPYSQIDDPSEVISRNTTPLTHHLRLLTQRLIDGDSDFCSRIAPDVLFGPFFLLPLFVNVSLLFNGAPGMYEPNRAYKLDFSEQVLIRGAISPADYSFLILLIHCYSFQVGFLKAWFENGFKERWQLKTVDFGLETKDTLTTNSAASDDQLEYELEASLIRALLFLGSLQQPLGLGNTSSREVSSHHRNLGDGLFLSEIVGDLGKHYKGISELFSLQNCSDKSVLVRSNWLDKKKQATELLNSIAVLEHSVWRTFSSLVSQWYKLRASDKLIEADADKSFRWSMESLMDEWPDAIPSDTRLATTAARSAFISKQPVGQKRADPIRRKLDGIFNRHHGIRSGNIGRVKKTLPDETKDLIVSLIPDLLKILPVAWPMTEIPEQRERVKQLNLKRIKRNHLNFNWDEVKANERFDLLAKIVAEFLEEQTQTPYHLKTIKHFLKDKLPK
jgi:hypothetical protein